MLVVRGALFTVHRVLAVPRSLPKILTVSRRPAFRAEATNTSTSCFPAKARSPMSTKPLPSDLPIQPFATAGAFEAFLEREHGSASGVYLKLAKKASGIPSISAAEAVEIALCFGWIDGRANSVDQNWWLVRYTPRRSKSIWSQKNVNTVERLRLAGRIRPAGEAAVQAAKADGRWDRAYAGPATMTVPDDLAAALAVESPAAIFMNELSKNDRYTLLMRLQTASANTRDQRIKSLVKKLAQDHANSVASRVDSSGKKKTTARKVIAKNTSVPISTKTGSATDNTRQNLPRRAGLRHRP